MFIGWVGAKLVVVFTISNNPHLTQFLKMWIESYKLSHYNEVLLAQKWSSKCLSTDCMLWWLLLLVFLPLLCGPIASWPTQPLRDRFCKHLHTLCILGKNRCSKCYFEILKNPSLFWSKLCFFQKVAIFTSNKWDCRLFGKWKQNRGSMSKIQQYDMRTM